MGLKSKNLCDNEELVTRTAVKMGCQVHIKSAHRVESFSLINFLEKQNHRLSIGYKIFCKLLYPFGLPSWPLKGSMPYMINSRYFNITSPCATAYVDPLLYFSVITSICCVLTDFHCSPFLNPPFLYLVVSLFTMHPAHLALRA